MKVSLVFAGAPGSLCPLSAMASVQQRGRRITRTAAHRWMRWSLSLALLAGASVAATAATYTVGGSISGLTGNGLVLNLQTTSPPPPPACIADGGTFTLQSTDTNDCFIPANFNKCCSQSIMNTAFDGISIVTCTCGNIPPIGKAAWAKQFDGHNILKDLSQDLPVPANATTFTFATAADDGSTYVATIKTQPTNQSCVLTNGTGTINGANVTNVQVSCTTITYVVTAAVASGGGGTVTPPSQTGNSGSQATVTVTADPGYRIQGVTGCGGSISGNIYTTAALTGNCAVTATFAELPPIPTPALSTELLLLLGVTLLASGIIVRRVSRK